MKHSILRLIPILFLALFVTSQLSAQDGSTAQESETAKDTTIAPIVPYALAGISEGSNNTVILLQEAGSKQISDEKLEEFETEVDSIFVILDPFLADTIFHSLGRLNSRSLENADTRIKLYMDQISALQDRLNKRYKILEEEIVTLDAAKEKWLLTRENKERIEIPETLIGRIDQSIHRIDSVSTLLQEDRTKLLLLQDRILNRNTKLLNLQGKVENAGLALDLNLFVRDVPNFFKDFSNLSDTNLIPAHTKAVKRNFTEDLKIFKSDFSEGFKFIIFLFIVLTSFLYWFKYNYKKVISTERVKFDEIQLKLIQSPGLVALFAVSAIVALTIPKLPISFMAINILILILPMGILAIRFYGLKVRSWVILITAVFVMTIIYEFLYSPDILQRIMLMFLSIVSLLLFIRLVIKLPSFTLTIRKGVYHLVRNIGFVFILLLLIALVANLIGLFHLSEFFSLIPIQISFNLVIILIVIRYLDLVLYLLLGSNFMLKLNVVSDFFDMIHRRLGQVVSLFFWIFFFAKVLRILKLNKSFFDWGGNLLTTNKKIGQAEISLESILIFVFVIWLSVFLTKVVSYILEKDVFVRLKKDKGSPVAVVMMVRIIMITGGFLLAAAAAGMELTNLSIVIGAFSVGIGFGLQSIFNNMVSGLVLAIEKPINVGDTVEVGTLMGIVKSIGLRASKVKSFDGAEMVVPNGMLISDVLINWTLSDAYRRMDIRVGVAYGSDPNQVVDILNEVALENKQVRKYPEPKTYFIGFGDSSLDFRLLAWVDVDSRLSTESQVNVAINAKLAEADIEIPFPQRDLHIRSDDTKPEPGSREEK
jgi:potassium efflux system protein